MTSSPSTSGRPCPVCATPLDPGAAPLFAVDGQAIVRCPDCGLVQRAVFPTSDELAALYAADYFVAAEGSLGAEGYLDYVADADVHRASARRRRALLARHATPGRLLDVGCAAGFFVDEAAGAGWTARGIDVSAPMVSWGVEHLDAELDVATLADLPQDEPESCITMWDYLEHSIDPRSDVEAAYARLRPGGVLALSTGDAGSLVARLSLRRWHLMTPRHHNAFFSRATIRRLLESVGFEVVSIGAPASVFPLRYLAHKAGLVVDARPVHALSARLTGSHLGSRTLPVNLWDVMTVVARRPAGAVGRAP
jgi:2-polyprenyl-3-methyl-5-hydroxy-6-metoxy-1,4-benzoquinol methylase